MFGKVREEQMAFSFHPKLTTTINRSIGEGEEEEGGKSN